MTGTRSIISWTDLFAAKGPMDCALAMRVIKKAGEPFLILPESNALAARALTLYPAQTTFARAAKRGLSTALKFGLPTGLSDKEIQFSRDDAFPKFLIEMGGAKANAFPELAILAGNPHAEGRRFIVLLFDAVGEPTRVVKAGIGKAATQLIERESSFLQSLPTGISGLPKFSGTFSDARIAALAMDFVEGDSPRGEEREKVRTLLSGWLDRNKRARADGIPAWQTLAREHGGHPMFATLAAKLGNVEFYPTLYHGDFAPWNIKVSRDGSWRVLDWERGDRLGVPGWDWFHYSVQRGALVEKLTPDALARKWEALLTSAEFRTYAERAGIVGNEKVFAAAYLLYCVEMLRQSEGMETMRGLLALIGEKWAKA
jgi:hypothetical protein